MDGVVVVTPVCLWWVIVKLDAEVCDTVRIGKGVILGLPVVLEVASGKGASEPAVAPLLFLLDPEELESEDFEPGA